MDAKEEFWRQWGVDGKPGAVMRIVEAAWEAATLAEREACAKVCDEQANEPECPERARYCAEAIRERLQAKLVVASVIVHDLM